MSPPGPWFSQSHTDSPGARKLSDSEKLGSWNQADAAAAFWLCGSEWHNLSEPLLHQLNGETAITNLMGLSGDEIR